MASQSVSIDQLGVEIAARLQDYSREVEIEIIRGVEETAKETRDLLRKSSPERTGKYAKGWTIRWGKRDFPRATIHAGRHARLTHLLEKGHAKRNGGRVEAIPHIEFAAEFAEQQLYNRIDDAIRKAAR